MKNTLLITSFFLLFINAQKDDTNEIESQLSFKVYQWTTFTLSKLNLPNDCKVSIKGNAVLRNKDSIFQILPLDTIEFTLQLKHERFDKSVKFHPKSNEHFNPDWKKLEHNQRPTGLISEEVRAYYNYAQNKMLNRPIPNVKLETINSKTLDSTSFRGKVTFLNFWYYGCLPCMAEMPAINKLNEHYKYNENVQVFSMFRDSIKINNHESIPLFESLGNSSYTNYKYRKVETKLTQVPNCKKFNSLFNIYSYPTSIIIDQKGIIRFINVGADPEGDNHELMNLYKNKIDEIINERQQR